MVDELLYLGEHPPALYWKMYVLGPLAIEELKDLTPGSNRLTDVPSPKF